MPDFAVEKLVADIVYLIKDSVLNQGFWDIVVVYHVSNQVVLSLNPISELMRSLYKCMTVLWSVLATFFSSV